MRWYLPALGFALGLAALAGPADARPEPADDGAPRAGAPGLTAAAGGPGVMPAAVVADATDTTAGGTSAAASAMYIVVLDGEPLASYTGDVPGLAATSPSVTGEERIEDAGPAVETYLDHLTSAQDGFLSTAAQAIRRAPEVRFRYRYATNGLALRLSPAEAERLADLPGVVQVEPAGVDHVTTDRGPTWIGAPGVWDGTALGRPVGTYGEGVVVGDIDTGIALGHRSFAEVDERGYEHLNPRGRFFGMCDPDNAHYNARYVCNDKLIGVYSFLPTGTNAMDPEDDNGHGTHTASTAAGNFVSVGWGAPTIDVPGVFSGVAPHANIIAYDACYTASNGLGTCPGEATLAALDQAVADGVDVINYSIETGQGSPWTDVHYQAWRRVRDAGIFASVSAGNAGPTASTANAVAPWTMSVAATTHDRAAGLVGLTNAAGETLADLDGQALTRGYGPAPIVYAKGVKNVDGAEDDGMCARPFPAETWTGGEIVVCDRGANVARLDKGKNVLAGGAGGMVLANAAGDGDGLAADPHVLPAVHVGYAAGRGLKTWLEKGEGPTGEITSAILAPRAASADVTAGFSSRGPAISASCCRRPGLDTGDMAYYPLVKPDVGTPGVQIIAAVPPGPDSLAAMDGTSMAAPHAAGAAALVIAAHPDWTPAEVQSALMTTAQLDGVRKENRRYSANPSDVGAGRINVSRAVRAGLVLDVTAADLDAAGPARGGDVRTINLPSMADVTCLDRCTWTRTVKSTLERTVSWSADVAAPSNLGVTVTPAEFDLPAGGSRTITIEADATRMGRGSWAYASVSLTPSDETVPAAHLPMTVRAVASDLPGFALIQTRDAEGSQGVPDMRLAAATDLFVTVRGMTRGKAQTLSLDEDKTPMNRWDTDATGSELVFLTVPDGTRRLVAEISSAEGKDVDLFVGLDVNGDRKADQTEMRGNSLSEGWNELVELSGDSIESGRYWVLVQNFTGSKSQPDDITLVTAIVPEDDSDNLAVAAPVRVTAGTPFAFDLSWDLPTPPGAGDRWYGLLELGSSAATPADIGTIMVDLLGLGAPTPTPDVTATASPTATARATRTLAPTSDVSRPTATPVSPPATLPPMPQTDIFVYLPYLSRNDT